jgi:hypothetical protein
VAASNADRDDLLQRIQKLLALGTSANEHEANLALSKAQELMAKYAVSMSEVESHGVPKSRYEQFAISINLTDETERRWKEFLYAGVAMAFECRFILTDFQRAKDSPEAKNDYLSRMVLEMMASLQKKRLVGHLVAPPEMPAVIMWYFDYISETVTRLSRDAFKEYAMMMNADLTPEEFVALTQRPRFKEEHDKWNTSFRMGLVSTVIARLMQKNEQIAKSDPTFKALMVNRSAEVDAKMTELFPKTQQIKDDYDWAKSSAAWMGGIMGYSVPLDRPIETTGETDKAELPSGRSK